MGTARAPQIARLIANRGTLSAVLRSPLVRIAATMLAVLLLLRSVDMPKTAHGLREAKPEWIILGLVLTALVEIGSILAWGILLRGTGHRFGWGTLSSWYLQGLFVGQVMPAGVAGDAMRAVQVGKVTGHGHALASLAGSRMAGTLGMALWGVAGAVLLRTWLGPSGIGVACLFLVAMVAAWIAALGGERLVRWVTRFGRARRQSRVYHLLAPFTHAFGSYRQRPALVLKTVAIAAAAWGINLWALAVFARSIDADVSWSLFSVAMPITLLATLTPFSVNGLGLREGVLVGLLAHAGVNTTHAGALTVLVDVQVLPFALIGAVFWMRSRRSAGALKHSQLVQY